MPDEPFTPTRRDAHFWKEDGTFRALILLERQKSVSFKDEWRMPGGNRFLETG